jgi:hypothetical protein
MLDRLVQAAARAAGVSSMVLGLRYGDHYEFISSYGVPLSAYIDRVPGKLLRPKLFMREVEVEDLQREPNFTALSIAEIAKTWRYGCNVPVQLVHPLSDGGVLALSGADQRVRKTGSKALSEMRRIAEIIGDSVWLIQQIEIATARKSAVETVRSILIDGVKNSRVPVALTDEALEIIGYSDAFAEEQQRLLSSEIAAGQNLAAQWLDLPTAAACRASQATMQPIIAGRTAFPDGSAVRFDFHNLQFEGVPDKFGVFGLHARDLREAPERGASLHEQAVASLFPAGDGLGPVSRFLFDTLIEKRRLLRSKGQSYVALNTWAKPVKKYQVAALKALKTECPDAFVMRIADEIAAEAIQLFGSLSDHVVVAVPCGHSGSGCLSDRLGQRLADRLGIDQLKPFDCPPVSGSSHPKANVKRPRIKLTEPVTRPVILVDDVVTTGSHIEEAGRLLASAAPSVWANMDRKLASKCPQALGATSRAFRLLPDRAP